MNDPFGEAELEGFDPPHELTQSFDLIRSAQRGDTDALDRLIERYYPRVLKVVRLRMGTTLRNRSALESGDIVQNTFKTAISIFDRFENRNEGSLINWLSKIAQNKILEEAGRPRKPTIPLDALDSNNNPIDPAASALTPSQVMEKYEDEQMLEACISLLPEKYRETCILRDFLNCTFEELAKEIGSPSADAARMLHNKALVELEKIWRRQTGSA